MTIEKKIRVLIVDDSALMRRIIMTSLLKHDDIDVVGTAANGLLALEAIKKTKPDVITLDVEMPEMDGIETLKEIRKTNSALHIIMFSTTTQLGTRVTIDALTHGANDYVSKPNDISNIQDAYQLLENTLIPKIKALYGSVVASSIKDRGVARREQMPPSVTEKTISLETKSYSSSSSEVNRIKNRPLYPVAAVCIGVSTGGPEALKCMFALWRSPLSVPIFIVQHMMPKFITILAARLSEIGVIQVQEPYEGQEALPGLAYIAPGGFHMVLKRSGTKVFISLNEDPPENSCRPAVDVLFRSAAQVYGRSLLAVVLTGMGYDGLKGAQEVVASNGVVIAQDKETSVIWGMPGAIVEADLAEKTLPIDQIPNEILFRTTLK
ncbi:MAG: hypothetical protein RLZ75_1817 [Pseudomonadota bacterium]|jgi:two-component system chemotaxis response regulator CheB